MLIARARPRYIIGKYKCDNVNIVDDDHDFFLNSGSRAFYFFLRTFNKRFKKITNRRSRVGIQSFTCPTMLDAIVESGSEAFVFDVKREDASISLNEVKNIDLDILVLTHYQGIPNKEYFDFAEYCKKKEILLVDDLAHVSKSTIEGVEIGKLSNLYVESYRFDKPFAAVNGGLLHVNNINEFVLLELRDEYNKLKIESKKHVHDDIDLLYFLLDYTYSKSSEFDIDYMRFIEHPALKKMWNKKLFGYKFYRDIVKGIGKLSDHILLEDRTELYRIDNLRMGFIKWQKDNFNSNYTKLSGYDYQSLLQLPDNPFDKIGDFIWNRYSLIDESGEIRSEMQRKGIIAKNYNWTKTLLDWKVKYLNMPVYYIGKLENSEYLKRNIINIPIWQLDSEMGGVKYKITIYVLKGVNINIGSYFCSDIYIIWICSISIRMVA